MRKPISAIIGWHVTPSKNVEVMLNGIAPISRGVFLEERMPNKTYFFRHYDDAICCLVDLLEDNRCPTAIRNGKLVFPSKIATDYMFSILQLNLNGLTLFEDQECERFGFTTEYISAQRIKLMQVPDWLPEAKRHALKCANKLFN